MILTAADARMRTKEAIDSFANHRAEEIYQVILKDVERKCADRRYETNFCFDTQDDEYIDKAINWLTNNGFLVGRIGVGYICISWGIP